ncbi:MAG TPA: SCO family protein [Pyrinomonadaceae bacterium]|jgi:protein SCO1/2|nr:SCO family protein [Pyrinomonadaceae bacterium]
MKPQKSTKGTLSVLLMICVCLVASCRRSGSEQRYDLKGKVLVVEPHKHLVTVSHEDIKGYMPAMTMPFTVRSESDLQILAPDDEITATLVIDGSHSWLEDLIITRQSANTPAMPGVTMAKEGDEVPNFALRNQDNREIHIHDYRGRTLLLTFIYTRCPVPDYCTLMSNNFAQIDRALGQDAGLYAKTHLLSISIDPSYDTPQVLRSYGAAHTERYQNETFAHWEFASGTTEQVKKIAAYFGLTYFPEKDQIIHALRTVIVDSDGKIAKIYSGNDWKPEEVVEVIHRLHR